MLNLWLAAAVSTNFTVYPGFVDPKAQIEAVTDLGPVLEVVLKCQRGTAIMSYSKVEGVYCTPKWVCYDDMKQAIARSCR